jgi:RimK family alpha-L-glutamate ligase
VAFPVSVPRIVVEVMRIGVLGNANSWYVEELRRAGNQRGHTMHALRFEEFHCHVRASEVTWRCGDVVLNGLDALIVRTMPPGSLEQVVSRMDLLSGLAAAGVPVINSPRSLECAVDKYLTTQKLSQCGLPVPDTIICESADAALNAFEVLGGDVLVKPLFGAEGRGILHITELELARRTFHTLERLGAVLYIQQRLTASDEDLRVLLLDGAVLAAMKRKPRPGEFRANLAQQATAVSWLPSEDEVQLARLACEAIGCMFAGVDLMRDAAGRAVVIEVNAVPGWRGLQRVCNVDVPGAVLDWLQQQDSPLQEEQESDNAGG